MPLAPKIRGTGRRCASSRRGPGSCPRPCPSARRTSERVETTCEGSGVAAMGRRDHVRREERASTRRRQTPPGRSTGGRSRVFSPSRYSDANPLFEPADQEHPPVHLDEVGGLRAPPCTVLSVQDRGVRWPKQIEIPGCFPSGPTFRASAVVMTGASRGLGRVLAHAFSQAGARVTLVARTEKDLKEVARSSRAPPSCVAAT